MLSSSSFDKAWDCAACLYFDALIRMGGTRPAVVEVIAAHMRTEHEPPG